METDEMKASRMEVRKEVLGVKAPKKAFDSENYDKNCPFTGRLAVKKELLKGKVVKKDTNKSATIEWNRPFFVPKYERYEMRRSRLRVHNPPCIDAQVGQKVLVARTRPLSKTKNHVILQVLEKDDEIIESKVNAPARKKKELENIERVEVKEVPPTTPPPTAEEEEPTKPSPNHPPLDEEAEETRDEEESEVEEE